MDKIIMYVYCSILLPLLEYEGPEDPPPLQLQVPDVEDPLEEDPDVEDPLEEEPDDEGPLDSDPISSPIFCESLP